MVTGAFMRLTPKALPRREVGNEYTHGQPGVGSSYWFGMVSDN